MILPESMHRHWNVLEPTLLSVSSAGGGIASLVLASEATTAPEYGALFVGFLIFLGMAVLGIAGFTATYIAKKLIEGLADIGGQNAEKVLHLHTQEQFDARFLGIEQAAAEQSKAVVSALNTIKENLTGLSTSVGLLNQEIRHQVELRGAIEKDVATLHDHVFGNHPFTRRSDDKS